MKLTSVGKRDDRENSVKSVMVETGNGGKNQLDWIVYSDQLESEVKLMSLYNDHYNSFNLDRKHQEVLAFNSINIIYSINIHSFKKYTLISRNKD